MAEKIKALIEKGNGGVKLVLDILKTLLIAGIIGLMTMWGASREMSTEIKNLACSMSKMEQSITNLDNKFFEHIVYGHGIKEINIKNVPTK